MPKYLTNNAVFEPFTFDRYLQPLQLVGDEYIKLQDSYSEVEQMAAPLGSQIDPELDPAYSNIWNEYMEGIGNAATNLTINNMPTMRKELNRLRKLYQEQIVPIAGAVANKQAAIEQYDKMQLESHNKVLYSRDPRQVALSEYVTGTPQFDHANLNTIEGEGKVLGAALSSRVWVQQEEKYFNNAYYALLQKNGIAPEQDIEDLINRNAEFRQAFLLECQKQRIFTEDSPFSIEQQYQMRNALLLGMLSGLVNKEDVDLRQNPYIGLNSNRGSTRKTSSSTSTPVPQTYNQDLIAWGSTEQRVPRKERVAKDKLTTGIRVTNTGKLINDELATQNKKAHKYLDKCIQNMEMRIKKGEIKDGDYLMKLWNTYKYYVKQYGSIDNVPLEKIQNIKDLPYFGNYISKRKKEETMREQIYKKVDLGYSLSDYDVHRFNTIIALEESQKAQQFYTSPLISDSKDHENLRKGGFQTLLRQVQNRKRGDTGLFRLNEDGTLGDMYKVTDAFITDFIDKGSIGVELNNGYPGISITVNGQKYVFKGSTFHDSINHNMTIVKDAVKDYTSATINEDTLNDIPLGNMSVNNPAIAQLYNKLYTDPSSLNQQELAFIMNYADNIIPITDLKGNYKLYMIPIRVKSNPTNEIYKLFVHPVRTENNQEFFVLVGGSSLRDEQSSGKFAQQMLESFAANTISELAQMYDQPIKFDKDYEQNNQQVWNNTYDANAWDFYYDDED